MLRSENGPIVNKKGASGLVVVEVGGLKILETNVKTYCAANESWACQSP